MTSNCHIVGEVLSQAAPNALSQLASVMIGFVTVMFVSRLQDSTLLGAVGLGTMVYNVMGLSLGIGLTSGLDTLVSRSNGSCNYVASGVHMQRAVVVVTLVCIPSSILLFFIGDIFTAIGQDAAVAQIAGEYVRAMLIGMWPMYMASAINTFLRAQKIPSTSVYVTWLANVAHVVFCYVFIWHLQWGAFGAGLAFASTQVLSFSVLFATVHFLRPGVTKESWIPWNWKRATSNLGTFLSLSVPCALLMWTEWWCFEIMALMAGYLGAASLAAHTSVNQLFVLIFMTSGGISCAGAALVGNAIGAGSVSEARRSAFITTILMLVVAALINGILEVYKEPIASLFTDDPVVHGLLVALLRVLLVVVPLDCLQTVIDGILRGLGKQGLAFKVKVFCLWVVRTPLGLLFAFHDHWGITGIWWGAAAGLAVTLIMYLCILWRVDWEEEVLASEEYLQLDEGPRSRTSSGLSMRSPGGCIVNVPGLCRSPGASLFNNGLNDAGAEYDGVPIPACA